MKDENEKNQSIQTLPVSLDGPVAAPEHHRIIFENEQVRVVDFRVKPGETVPVHTHRWATVNYVINHSDFLSYDADGNLKHDSREARSEIKEGAAFFLPSFPPPHSVENIGKNEMRGVSVELKDHWGLRSKFMAESPIVLCNDNVCRPMQPNGYSSGNIVITASVGIKGVNQKPDVHTIQQALNEVPPNQGRPVLALTTDGICGPKTKDAVQKFQVKHFGWKFADGRVDPLKKTIAKLNQLNPKSGYTVGIGSKENRIVRVTAVLGEVLNIVRAAQTNLLAALTVVDSPDLPTSIPSFSRAEKMKKANAHFEVDRHPRSQRSGVLRELLHIYDRMRQVFERPGGLWGPAIFEPDPTNDPISLAFTFGGGFARGGEKIAVKGIELRADSIYLCNLLDLQMNERIQLTIIHELAHFCGGRTGSSEHIRDHAYGWHDFPKMKHLTLAQKLHNATCYANFAFDAKYSRKPAGANF